MTRLGTRRRASALTALAVAAATSAAMLTTTAAGSAATPTQTTVQGTDQPAVTEVADAERSGSSARHQSRRVNWRLLSINDFHGQLEPSTSSSSGAVEGTRAGGAEYLATHLRQLRQEARAEGRRPVGVAAGDLIGATPLVSAAFHDEPTIEAMNQMRLKVASVGNHEFDEGWRELVRMQQGGCIKDGPDGKENQNSCPDGRFEGADFQYLAANVIRDRTGKTILPAVEVKTYKGVPVGFIGMTLEDTPNIVTKAGVRGLEFTDEADTANRVARRLYARGVKSIVVLVHEGGFPSAAAYNGCPGISGPIVEIHDNLSSRIDMVLTGHTHQAYNCTLEDPAGAPRLVTSAASLGRVVTEIDFTVDRRTGDIVREFARANNRIVTQTVEKAQALTELIARYKELVAPIESKVIGSLNEAAASTCGDTSCVTKTADQSGESPLGNLIADAQRADESLLAGGPAPEVAFMNPGGIRADLLAQEDGDVTYGSAFSTQPFNNYDVAMDLTGTQILALLEEQWSGVNSVAAPKILQVSGLTYTYDSSQPSGSRVVRDTVEVNGEPLEEGRTYRVTANSFLSDGGDGFSVFAEGTDKYFGGLDIDALAAYLAKPENTPYTPVETNRITVQP
ncbi:MAG: 5'-nucleotidase [uncultured Nocardioidaceae bacterium]|uniref:5'-nucleotidase n=1 Tax=uncultured Nocardioidaceae bacterium TaxID=253824 RepID=A0A6J4LQL6_9ACTN|nr:MAG: 5'-nucleotidase [uncultured Nocardioidaceae bacterium]